MWLHTKKVSVASCHPSDKKTSTFSIKDLRKNTFTKYVISSGEDRVTLQM